MKVANYIEIVLSKAVHFPFLMQKEKDLSSSFKGFGKQSHKLLLLWFNGALFHDKKIVMKTTVWNNMRVRKSFQNFCSLLACTVISCLFCAVLLKPDNTFHFSESHVG